MMKLNQVMDDFITLAIQSGGWMELDRLYVKNRLLAMIGGKTPESDFRGSYEPESADSIADSLIVYAMEEKAIANDLSAKETLKGQLLDLLTPPPSVVNAFFAQHYSSSPEEATTYFYELNKRSSYIKSPKLVESYQLNTAYGEFTLRVVVEEERACLENAAKVEQSAYPKCRYCFENEGFSEAEGACLPSRRLIRMNVGGESWGFQFAQAESFSEKFVISSEKHQALVMDEAGIIRMTQLLDIFPHYFISLSTADEMEHGHYIGGKEIFPLSQATANKYVELADFPLMNVSSLNWPFPVIRLQSPNAEDINRGIAFVLDKWQQNQNGEAVDDKVIIGRKSGSLYEFDLLLIGTNKDGQAELQSKKSTADCLGIVEVAKKSDDPLMTGMAAEAVMNSYLKRLEGLDVFGRGLFELDTIEAFLDSIE